MKLSASITSLSTWIPYLFGSSMSWTLPRHRPVHWWLVGFDVQGRFVSLNRPTMWLGKFDHDQSLFSRTLEMMVREMIPWIMAELFRLVKYFNFSQIDNGYDWDTTIWYTLCQTYQWRFDMVLTGNSSIPSAKLRVCYWKWPFIVDFSIKSGDFPQLC